MTNAHSAREWLLKSLKDESSVALSTSLQFQLMPKRYQSSVLILQICSASGIGSVVAIQWTLQSAFRQCLRLVQRIFRDMLDGFHQMDEHFRTAPFEKNLPVLMGLLTVLYNDFFNVQTIAVLPYEQYLKRFPCLPATIDDGE